MGNRVLINVDWYETITQPPATHHAIPRGRAGPGLLAMIVCDKFAMHLPLTRQSHGRRGR